MSEEYKQDFRLSFRGYQITDEGEQLAMHMAEASLGFESIGERMYLAKEIPDEAAQLEARFIANLSSTEDREERIRLIIEFLVMILKDAQILSRIVLDAKIALDNYNTFLESLKDVKLKDIQRRPAGEDKG